MHHRSDAAEANPDLGNDDRCDGVTRAGPGLTAAEQGSQPRPRKIPPYGIVRNGTRSGVKIAPKYATYLCRRRGASTPPLRNGGVRHHHSIEPINYDELIRLIRRPNSAPMS
jgi:hypothetical protein